MTVSNVVTVYALIYSGRQDPSWELAGKDLETLKTKLKDLPARGTRVVAGAGYKGFLVTNPAGLPGLPWLAYIYHGCISLSDAEGSRRFYEDGHHVEQWLITLTCALPFGSEIRDVLAKSSGPVPEPSP